MIDFSSLLTKQKALRDKIELERSGTKFHRFSDLVFYDGMNFMEMNDDNLFMAHVYLHKSYSMSKSELPHKTIESLHRKLISAMSERNIKHTNFDKLDGKLT